MIQTHNENILALESLKVHENNNFKLDVYGIEAMYITD